MSVRPFRPEWARLGLAARPTYAVATSSGRHVDPLRDVLEADDGHCRRSGFRPCVGRRYGAERVPAWGAVLGEVPSQEYLRIVAGVEQMGVPRRVTGGWLRGDGQPS